MIELKLIIIGPHLTPRFSRFSLPHFSRLRFFSRVWRPYHRHYAQHLVLLVRNLGWDT
jgi:hypothetical protein